MTKKQKELIHQVSTWMHFIGGHYQSPAKFIKEAQKQGITRRIPAQIARGMSFGDRVVFLRYAGKHNGGAVTAFAEMVIDSLVLEQSIAKQVGDRLIAEGRAEYQDGGGAAVERECGSYMVAGTYVVNASIPEIAAMAIEESKNAGLDKAFVMIGGHLTSVYDEPVVLDPAPKFTRGFTRSHSQDAFNFYNTADDSEKHIVAVSGYQQNKRKALQSPRS